MTLNRTPCLLLAALAMLVSAATTAFPPDAVGAGQAECGDASVLEGVDGKWECTFGDGFDGGSLNQSKWVAQRTATSGYTNGKTACFVDSPDNISVSGGTLKLTARQEAEPFTCSDPYGNFTTPYTSGMVSTAEGRFSQAFGRFEVRARVSSAQVKGLHTAFWLWPVDPLRYGNPGSGEIDFAELYSQYPDRAIPYVHYDQAAPDPSVTNNYCMISNPAAFHTYAVEWTTSRIKIIYDGQTCLDHTWDPASPLVNPQPFDQPFLIALTQALGVATNAFDPATTPLPATTEVDQVRVWQWQPASTPNPEPLPAASPPPDASSQPRRKARPRRACKAAGKRAKPKRACKPKAKHAH